MPFELVRFLGIFDMWTLQAHTYSTTGRQNRMMEGQVAAMSRYQPAPAMQVPLLFVYIARTPFLFHRCVADLSPQHDSAFCQ